MAAHNLPLYLKVQHVYAFLCEDADGPGYMKIGRTGDIARRYSSLITGCPLPVKMIALLEVRTEEYAEVIEKAFHLRLRDRNTRGEWFRFDFRSPDDKKEFNAVTREIIRLFPRYLVSKKWRVIDLASLEGVDNAERMKHLGPEWVEYRKRQRELAKEAKKDFYPKKTSIDREAEWAKLVSLISKNRDPEMA